MQIRTLTGSSHFGIMRDQVFSVTAPDQPFRGAPLSIMGDKMLLTGDKMPPHWEIGQEYGIHRGQPSRAVKVKIISI